MIRNIISPNIVATFGVLLVSATIMLCTNLNMAPAIVMNLLYCAFSDSQIGNGYRRVARSLFNVTPWKPYHVALSVSTTIALYTTLCVAALQFANRLLFILMTLSRSRTPEQNAAAIAAQWNWFSFLFVKDSFAEEFSAITAFICIMWTIGLATSLIAKDMSTRGEPNPILRARRMLKREHEMRAYQPTSPLVETLQQETRRVVEETLQQEALDAEMIQQEAQNATEVLRQNRQIAQLRCQLATLEQITRAKQQLEQVMRTDDEVNLVLQQVLPELLRAMKEEEEQAQEKVAPTEEENSVANQLPNGFIADEPKPVADGFVVAEQPVVEAATVEDAPEDEGD